MDICQIATKVISGEQALAAFRVYRTERIFILCDSFLTQSGAIDLLSRQIAPTNQVQVFDDVVPDPNLSGVARAMAAAVDFQPTVLVAFGGGAAIDTAKGLVYFASGAHAFSRPPVFIVIPTTSGTGSEMTSFAVITDAEEKRKIALIDDVMYADVAILDPQLTVSVPPAITANTGFDVLTHAIEAYVSTANCDFTDPLAIHAIEMIQKDLVPSYNGDMAARDRMHVAQCLAGQAFSNALLGIVHSMAHKTGAIFQDYGAHIIHGAANAMYLPKVIAFNAKDPVAKKRYGVIADYMHLGGKDDDEKVALLIAYLRKMNDDLNIPHCIKNYGADSYPCEQGFVPEEVFLERLDDIAKNAILDACTGSNPRQPSQEEMVKLLKCCYYDTEVDF